MATTVLQVLDPCSSSYVTSTESAQSTLFLNVSDSELSFGAFGESASCTPTAFNSVAWPGSDPCSDQSSFTPAASFFGLDVGSDDPAHHHHIELGYPATEELDLLLDASSWMQPPSVLQPVMNPILVRTLKNMVTPAESCWNQAFGHDSHGDDPQLSPPSSDDGSLTTSTTLASEDSDEGGQIIQHEPPPLNMKRLEKVEEAVRPEEEDSVEAAEVSVALIQNRRPWQCGLAGCNKTFKNPQTMKMHHKTHYTDGSAVTKDGVTALPTLTPSLKAGQNKKIPSRCPKCRKTFVGLYELRRHYGRKHSEGEKPFGCRKCDKKFYIEVDVRDHEKLCGESIECRCGLKFAFKCNLVAHKKAHPACQDHQDHNQRASHTGYTVINSQSTTTSTISSDEESVSPDPMILPKGIKRRHHGGGQGENYPSSKHGKYYGYAAGLDPVGLPGIGKGGGGVSTTFKAAMYDFAGLQFSTEGSASWSSNMHYPSSTGLGSLAAPSTLPSSTVVYNSSVLSGLEQLGSQIYNSRQVHRV